jgi:hypothetical protein
MASRDTTIDIFQEENVGFKATIGLNKKKVHQSDVSAYVENVDLISLLTDILSGFPYSLQTNSGI